jgi:glutamyl-tRNA reductase
LEGLEPLALGISAPGPLDTRRGAFFDPPNLDRSLWDYPLADELARATGLATTMDKDTNVAALDFVDVANMDMLGDVTDEAYKKREKEVPAVKKIIEEEFSGYKLWLNEQRVVPTIKALTQKFETIRDEELNFFKNKLSVDEYDKVENLTRRIVNKIAAYSIEHLRDHHHSDEVAEMVAKMFKLESKNGHD